MTGPDDGMTVEALEARLADAEARFAAATASTDSAPTGPTDPADPPPTLTLKPRSSMHRSSGPAPSIDFADMARKIRGR